jgi:N-acetylmuramoyl-L-alanine amidase CwlA
VTTPPSPPMIPARWHGGRQTPRTIVLHSAVVQCSPGAARAVGAYFARVERKASAHYGVDPAETIQYVGDHVVAFHCGHNQDTIGVEMCEYPSMVNLARWATRPHRQMRRRAVNLVARLCLAYDIRPYFVGPRALRAGRHGVTTHNTVRLAFPGVTTHWDPGAWPRRRFMRQVRARIAQLEAAS